MSKQIYYEICSDLHTSYEVGCVFTSIEKAIEYIKKDRMVIEFLDQYGNGSFIGDQIDAMVESNFIAFNKIEVIA